MLNNEQKKAILDLYSKDVKVIEVNRGLDPVPFSDSFFNQKSEVPEVRELFVTPHYFVIDNYQWSRSAHKDSYFFKHDRTNDFVKKASVYLAIKDAFGISKDSFVRHSHGMLSHTIQTRVDFETLEELEIFLDRLDLSTRTYFGPLGLVERIERFKLIIEEAMEVISSIRKADNIVLGMVNDIASKMKFENGGFLDAEISKETKFFKGNELKVFKALLISKFLKNNNLVSSHIFDHIHEKQLIMNFARFDTAVDNQSYLFDLYEHFKLASSILNIIELAARGFYYDIQSYYKACEKMCFVMDHLKHITDAYMIHQPQNPTTIVTMEKALSETKKPVAAKKKPATRKVTPASNK